MQLLAPRTRNILERFLASPTAKKFEQQIEAEKSAKRAEIQKRIATLRAERAPAMERAAGELKKAQSDLDDHMRQIRARENAVSAASAKLHRAKSIHRAEIKRLENELAELTDANEVTR